MGRLASVIPLVATRALSRPFTYEVDDDVARGAVVEITLGRGRRRGVVVALDVPAPLGVKPVPVVRVVDAVPAPLVELDDDAAPPSARQRDVDDRPACDVVVDLVRERPREGACRDERDDGCESAHRGQRTIAARHGRRRARPPDHGCTARGAVVGCPCELM